jgi:hypothetical protein
MKKRILNKYFSQIKKNRKNVRLARKIGKKEMMYLYKNRKDIIPNNIWGNLFKILIDGKGMFGGMGI